MYIKNISTNQKIKKQIHFEPLYFILFCSILFLFTFILNVYFINILNILLKISKVFLFKKYLDFLK